MITVRTSPAYVNRVRQDWTANGGVYGDGGVYALVPSNDPFAQSGPTLDLTFAGNPTDLLTASTTAGYTLNTFFTPETYQIAVPYAVWGANGLEQKNFSDIVTFTRASTGTYFNSAGTLTTAAINEARFDFNPSTLAAQGLLIEESRTNLLLRSAEFDNASWVKTNSSVTANATAAPDGTTSGDKLLDNTTNGQHWLRQDTTVVANTTHTVSLFIKAAERNQVRFGLLNASTLANGAYAAFNVSTGTISGQTTAGSATNVAYSITAVGNGWYRCTVTATVDNSSTSITPFIGVLDASGNASYAGTGTDGIFLWGAQLEAGAFPTSYIPTTTTALTRSADVASVNTLSPWYNATEGTIYVEGSSFQNTSGPSGVITFDDGTGNNRIQVRRAGNTAENNTTVIVGGVGQANPTSGLNTWALNSTAKNAFAYAVNDFALVVNAATPVTDTSGTLPTVTRMVIGHGSTIQHLNGYLRRVVFYPRRLANADLQAITT